MTPADGLLQREHHALMETQGLVAQYLQKFIGNAQPTSSLLGSVRHQNVRCVKGRLLSM